MRLSDKEKETVYRAVCLIEDEIEKGKCFDFADDEVKALDTAHKKMRMEIYGF